eukprot:14909376-Alexandrium_andersonii.AAC.1
MQSPVVTTHTLAVVSWDVVRSCRPSDEKAALVIMSSWSSNVSRHSPVAVLHSFALLWAEAVERREASGEKATDVTQRSCPCSVRKQAP